MNRKMKEKIYRLCKLCAAFGIFFYYAGVSGIFFGEPDFPEISKEN